MSRHTRWLIEIVIIVLVVCLLVLPVVLASQLPAFHLNSLFLEIRGHFFVEIFCSFVALLIASMILTVSARHDQPGLSLVGTGFLFMSVMDFFHAITDPVGNREAFVLYHTLSALGGGLFTLAGIVSYALSRPNRSLSRGDIVRFAVGVGVMFSVASFYRAYLGQLPVGHTGESLQFAPLAHHAHRLAAFVYGLAAIAAYGYYRTYKQVIALIISGMLVIFAQSAYLFSLSHMWGFTWWLWHAVKVAFYLGVLVLVVVGFLILFKALEQSRSHLAGANHRLKKSRLFIRGVNQELHARNRMAQEAMVSFDLEHTISVVARAVEQLVGEANCSFILYVSGDELDETRRSFCNERRIVFRCRPSPEARPEPRSEERWFSARRSEDGKALHLPLQATGADIGRLIVTAQSNSISLSKKWRQLHSLAAEIGPILYNALSYRQGLDAQNFRTALLRVSTLLTATLNLDKVLQAVCGESARLLNGDGALVLLPNGDVAGSFYLAGKCCTEKALMTEQLGSWWGDLCFWQDFFKPALGRYHPTDSSRPHVTSELRKLGLGDKPPGAVAVFPLAEHDKLLGVMLVIRREAVGFSRATLAKGELLAEQVRIAINNAAAYKRLAAINEQLRLAEESKIKGERLAVLGQMAASVAHEIKNPLSAIVNCLAVLRTNETFSGKTRTAFGIIEDEVERLDKLAKDFLRFGRPARRDFQRVDLHQLAARLCGALEHHIAREKASIVVSYSVNSKGPVLVDAGGIEIVLWNLLLNAAQAITSQGVIKLRMSHRADYITLTVSDTGKGVAASERKAIFDPFYSNKSHGAGLGLAIVCQLVEAWGGRLRLFTRLGGGTTFIVRFPTPDASPSIPGSAYDAQGSMTIEVP